VKRDDFKLKLRCYVCGKPIIPKARFALVSPSTNQADRVFISHVDECLEQVIDDQPTLVVIAP